MVEGEKTRTLQVKLDGALRKNRDGSNRLEIAKGMLETSQSPLRLKPEELSFDPQAVAVKNENQETLGYLPREVAKLALPAIGKKAVQARLLRVGTDEIEIEIRLAEVQNAELHLENRERNSSDAVNQRTDIEKKPEEKTKRIHPASGFFVIILVLLYFAYKLLLKKE